MIENNKKLTIAIVDYGMGNLHSVKSAIAYVGDFETNVTSSSSTLEAADCFILPGVGAFGDAMENLDSRGLLEPIVRQARSGIPMLGICLGMQLLFDKSSEGGQNKGLGLIPGSVELMSPSLGARVPHVGWNDLILGREDEVFSEIGDDKNFYFVHSFHALCPNEYIIAEFEHGGRHVAAVRNKNIYGMQFHPEKSHNNGIHLLQNFIDYAQRLKHG